MKTLLTGFLQVFFVAVNTYFIAHSKPLGVLFASFLISFIWSFNVKRVAFGTMTDRVLYSTGAALGGISGYYFGGWIG